MVRTLLAVLITAGLFSCGGPQTPENPVIGLIVAVEGNRMEIEWGESQTTQFEIADDTVTREHLIDHMEMQWAVKVTFEGRGEALKAIRIEDATPTPVTTSPDPY